jgi:tetratricopeptide (TPR) repeat protein
MVRLLILILVAAPTMALSEEASHPFTVVRAVADGDYYSALKNYLTSSSSQVEKQAKIAAVESGAALSLPDFALHESSQLITGDRLSGEEEQKLRFIRALIGYQEGNYNEALKEASLGIDKCKIRCGYGVRLEILTGDAYLKLNKRELALAAYDRAEILAQDHKELTQEISFRKGEILYDLGEYQASKDHYLKITRTHPRAAKALRRLAEIYLNQKSYDEAVMCLTTGRAEFPEAFLDSWVDYALVEIAAKRHESEALLEISEAAKQRYPSNDGWASLLKAEAEVAMIRGVR